VFTLEKAQKMLEDKCSLEAFQEQMLSSEFNAAHDGESVYNAIRRLEVKPIRAWLRSLDFAARVGVIEWEDPLRVFFDACREGDEEYVSRMSEEHPEWLDKGCKHNGTPLLHVLCGSGLMRFVPEVVSRFGDVDVKASNGRTPLFYACSGGHLSAFEYLMSVGADVMAVSNDGRTVLHAACVGGNVAIVKALLDMGLDVDARDSVFQTPLHRACLFSGLDVVRLLVEHGADVSPPSPRIREFPLHFACRRGNLAMVRFLCEHGAVIDAPGRHSPLCNALGEGHVNVAEYLVRAGASVERVPHNIKWIITWAMLRECVSVMKFLLEREIIQVSEELIHECLRYRTPGNPVLRYVLLHEESAPFLSGVDESLLPDGFLGGCASLSKWREHELRMDLRCLMLSWRRGFVVSRLEG
jgi:ankyrin repeat protein